MKPKKKATSTVKKASKKPVAAKPIVLIDKTIATTKERTHVTIEDHLQMGDLKKLMRINKNLTPRDSCREKMVQCDFSPFSNNEGSSLSPSNRKNCSPRPKNIKDKKKTKQKHPQHHEKPCQKKKISAPKRDINQQKMTKEEVNQSAYENLFLRRLDEKKITERSGQSEVSIPKAAKASTNFPNTAQSKSGKSKAVIVRQLKHKIQEKYKKQLPGLKRKELKFLCSIVLIQRLWRQHRIKYFISEFIAPRPLLEHVSADSHREGNKLDMTATTQELTSQLIRKFNQISSGCEKKLNIEREPNSTEMETAKKPQNFNLKDLELSSELTPQREAKMIKFVECMRDISFLKPKLEEKKYRLNVFNIPQTLSEKCLMQKFYEKVFKDSPAKKNNFQIFSSKKEQKSLERSIQLFKTVKSPEKEEIIELEERFETQLQCHEHVELSANEMQKIEVSVETDQFYLEENENKEIKTLKQLNTIADGVISVLLNQFFQEYHELASKVILKRKKKGEMPGLKVTEANIREYFNGLISYMLEKYDTEIIRRFCLVNPSSFLKLHHEYEDQEYIEGEDDQQFSMPIVPHTLFYEYQIIYEEKVFKIEEKDKKYSNFLEGLIKYQNILLTNCMTDALEKARIDRVILPWDHQFEPERAHKKIYGRNELQEDLKKIIENICGDAFMKVGKFHERIDDPQEVKKVLKCIHKQYKTEGNDWSFQYEHLELRMDMAKYTQQQLLEEVISQLIFF